jgi:hypothetical protein
MGYPNLGWRHSAITGDIASLKQSLSASVEHLIPHGMEVTLASIDKLADYEEPLVANFELKGHLGSSTGKRLLIPGDLFKANSTPKFLNEKREVPVSFSCRNIVQDAIRINFPASLNVESLPTSEKIPFQNFAAYSMSTSSTSTSVTVQRNYSLGEIIYMAKEYPDLRSFYSKMETKDQESVVLTTTPVKAGKPAPAGN